MKDFDWVPLAKVMVDLPNEAMASYGRVAAVMMQYNWTQWSQLFSPDNLNLLSQFNTLQYVTTLPLLCTQCSLSFYQVRHDS